MEKFELWKGCFLVRNLSYICCQYFFAVSIQKSLICPCRFGSHINMLADVIEYRPSWTCKCNKPTSSILLYTTAGQCSLFYALKTSGNLWFSNVYRG